MFLGATMPWVRAQTQRLRKHRCPYIDKKCCNYRNGPTHLPAATRVAVPVQLTPSGGDEMGFLGGGGAPLKRVGEAFVSEGRTGSQVNMAKARERVSTDHQPSWGGSPE